jgi:hypothetical protein
MCTELVYAPLEVALVSSSGMKDLVSSVGAILECTTTSYVYSILNKQALSIYYISI